MSVDHWCRFRDVDNFAHETCFIAVPMSTSSCQLRLELFQGNRREKDTQNMHYQFKELFSKLAIVYESV